MSNASGSPKSRNTGDAGDTPPSDPVVTPPSNLVEALLLDARAAAQLLAVSESTLWKLHSSGRIPNPMRLGGRVVRWRREELEAWVRAGCPPRERWEHSLRPKDFEKQR